MTNPLLTTDNFTRYKNFIRNGELKHKIKKQKPISER